MRVNHRNFKAKTQRIEMTLYRVCDCSSEPSRREQGIYISEDWLAMILACCGETMDGEQMQTGVRRSE